MNKNAVATELTSLIDATTTQILDEWTAEAITSGADLDTFIADKLDAMEETEPEVRLAVGKMYVRRLMGVA